MDPGAHSVLVRGREVSSPTQRSLEHLRKQGYLPAVVEKFNSFTRRRHDLYGFIDIIAVKGSETLAVQATSGSNVSSRVAKITANENVRAVRDANWRIVVHGWRKNSKGRWQVREVDLS